VHPVVLMTRTAKCRDRWIGLCGGKRVFSLAHHDDLLGIFEDAVAVFSRDFFDNAHAYKMVQRTGNGSCLFRSSRLILRLENAVLRFTGRY